MEYNYFSSFLRETYIGKPRPANHEMQNEFLLYFKPLIKEPYSKNKKFTNRAQLLGMVFVLQAVVYRLMYEI